MRSHVFFWLIAFSSLIIIEFGLELRGDWLDDPYDQLKSNLSEAIVKQKQESLRLSESIPFGEKNDLELEYSYRIYSNGQLVQWSDNEFVPEFHQLQRIDTLAFSPDSTFLIRRVNITTQSQAFELFTFLPIRSSFRIQNQYLKDEFNRDLFFPFDVRLNPEKGIDILEHPQLILPIEVITHSRASLAHEIIGILILIVGCILIIRLMRFFTTIINSPGFKWLVVLLFPAIRLFQLILFPDALPFQGELYDPLVYSSGALGYTLADLVINLSLLLGLLLELSNLFRTHISDFEIQNTYKPVIFFLLMVLSFATPILLYEHMLSVNINSQVVLDISKSIETDLSRIFTYLSLILAAFCYLVANHLLASLAKKSRYNARLEIGLLVVISVTYYLLFTKTYWTIGVIHLIGMAVVWYNWDHPVSREKIGLSFLFLITMSLVASGIGGMSIYKYDEQTEYIRKQRFVSNLLIGNDIIGEYHLNNTLEKLSQDASIRARLLSPILVNDNMRAIVDQSMSNYLDKYEIEFFVYDSIGNPYGFTEEFSLQHWLARYDRTSYETSYRNLFFVPDLASGRHKYIGFVVFQMEGKPLGYFVLELTLKKFVNKSVFPSLLVESTPQFDIADYDYALFGESGLIYSQGNFPFESVLDNTDEDEYESGGYHFYSRTTGNGFKILVSSKEYRWNAILANVSMLFILTLIPVGVFPFFSKESQPSNSLAVKIQWFAGLSFTIPIIIISLGILNVLNESYKAEISRNYEKRSRNIAEFLVEDVERFLSNDQNRVSFVRTLSNVATVSQSDLMVFNRNGKLLGSNRDEVFQQQLRAPIINPEALIHIDDNQFQSVVLDESIGTLDFKTVYTGIFSYSDGRLLGILAVPFFDFRNHLNRQQIEVFDNIISLFSLIFLISLLVGNYSLKNLLNPIRLISERLRKINYVEEFNEPLEYHSSDEIGLLVQEYNGMMEKLSRSREELAKIQKETAWKEIARQVAHEIKNPLTPMKLKIQQLQRDFKSDSREYQVLDSLLVQVDALASTADSFSAFAKMPAPQNETFDLSVLVNNVISLYRNDDLEIKSEIVEDVMVYADPKIFSQILNNLVLNGLQSMKSDNQYMEFFLEKKGSKAHLSIKDNGSGIPLENREKVFVPYFSTKESGSGIGLALAKKGIEQVGGNIWFESEEGQGTTFFISLPLA